MGPKRSRNVRNFVTATTVNSPSMPNLSPKNTMSDISSSNNLRHNPSNAFNNPIINIQPFDGNSEQVIFFMNQIKQLATILNWNDTYTIAYTKPN